MFRRQYRMRSVRDHFLGRLPLKTSFWFYFLLPAASYLYLERLILAALSDAPNLYVPTAISLLVISRGVIFPCQLIGVFRSAEAHCRKTGDPMVAKGTQGLLFLAALFVLVDILDVAQSLVAYRAKWEYATHEQRDIQYSLIVSGDGRRLVIDGTLDFGVVRDVEKILAEHPKIVAVVLNSVGGMIYEGRGLGLLFKRKGLSTYVYGECSSACVTAFIGGDRRHIGNDGRIGFHQYRFASSKLHQFRSFYDVEEEQTRDLEMFRSQGVDEAFRRRIFERPGGELWFPRKGELLAGGVVHSVTGVGQAERPNQQLDVR